MRPPPYVIRRRQSLYIRPRLPRNIGAFVKRTRICRSPGTDDLREARGRAATLVARLHVLWDEARTEMAAMKPEDILSLRQDIPGVLKELSSLSREERDTLFATMDRVLKRYEADVQNARHDLLIDIKLLNIHKSAYQKGIIETQQAIIRHSYCRSKGIAQQLLNCVDNALGVSLAERSPYSHQSAGGSQTGYE